MIKKTLGWVAAVLTILCGCGWLGYVGATAGPIYGAGFSAWMPTLRLWLIGAAPIISGFIALRYRTWLGHLFQATVALLGIAFVYLDFAGKPERLGPFSGLPTPSVVFPAICLMIIPGVFWYITGRAGWVEPLWRTIPPKFVVGIPLCLLLMTVVSAVIIDFMTIWSGECHFSEQPFVDPLSPDQGVFTAQIIGSGKLWGPNDSAPSPYWRRYWSLAWVQRKFWGVPWWESKVVILLTTTRGIGVAPPHSEIEFVDGHHLPGSLTRFLPIFDTFCTRTGSMADSEIDLRVLRDGRPHEGVRILGRTVRLTHPHNDEWIQWEPAPAMKVVIRGLERTTVAVSDVHGFYDVSELPPGYYEVGREPTTGMAPSWREVECRWQVQYGEIRDCTVNIH